MFLGCFTLKHCYYSQVLLLHPQATSTDHGGPRTSDLSIERRRRNHFTTAPLIYNFYDSDGENGSSAVHEECVECVADVHHCTGFGIHLRVCEQRDRDQNHPGGHHATVSRSGGVKVRQRSRLSVLGSENWQKSQYFILNLSFPLQSLFQFFSVSFSKQQENHNWCKTYCLKQTKFSVA